MINYTSMDEIKMLSFPLLSFEKGKQTKTTLNDVDACGILLKVLYHLDER